MSFLHTRLSRLVGIGMTAWVLGSGASCTTPHLAETPTGLSPPDEASRLWPSERKTFSDAVVMVPIRKALRQRFVLLAGGLERFTVGEADLLLRSSLAWLDALSSQEKLRSPECTEAAGDLGWYYYEPERLAQMVPSSECQRRALILAAVHLTRAAIETQVDAGPKLARAWTAATERLWDEQDTCPRDESELGAVAAAVRRLGDVASVYLAEVASSLGSCQVVTLSGPVRLVRDRNASVAANSSWERREGEEPVAQAEGGGSDQADVIAELAAQGESKLPAAGPRFDEESDVPVVVVEVGGGGQGNIYRVIWSEHGWRVTDFGGWTS